MKQEQFLKLFFYKYLTLYSLDPIILNRYPYQAVYFSRYLLELIQQTGVVMVEQLGKEDNKWAQLASMTSYDSLLETVNKISKENDLYIELSAFGYVVAMIKSQIGKLDCGNFEETEEMVEFIEYYRTIEKKQMKNKNSASSLKGRKM